MKKLAIFLSVAAIVAACSDVKRKPGKTYVPDMAYSRAYETYADHSNLSDKGISYNALPVAGTMARGAMQPFPYEMDAFGDTTNYNLSRQVKNPLPGLTADEYVEAERKYLINCGICHGTKLDGNGPLYNDGNGPYPLKPVSLVGDNKFESMPEGQMFYSITYGKNSMGSYASQLNTKQRWQVIEYIKIKQGLKPAPTGKATPVADSTSTAQK